MKIIALNGPPGCGKDAIGESLMLYLEERGLGVTVVKFARPIKAIAGQMLDLRYEEQEQLKSTLVKNMGIATESALIANWTLRDLMIWISEGIMKPFLGEDIFGRLLLGELRAVKRHKLSYKDGTQRKAEFAIITDGGFQSEFLPLLDSFAPEDILIIEVTRKNCSFEGDSRGYVGLELLGKYGTRYMTLINHEDQLGATVAETVQMLEDFGWLKSSTQQT